MKIFWLNEEVFNKRVNVFSFAEATKTNIKVAYANFLEFMVRRRYVEPEELILDDNLIDEVVIEFLNEKETFASKTIYKTTLKPIFTLHNIEFDRSKYNITNYEEFKDVSNNFLTEEEFKAEIEMVYNPSDKLMLYMAYLDILGNNFENITYAQKKDVHFDDKKWDLYDNRIIDFEDNILLEVLLKNTIKQAKYIPYKKLPENGNMPDCYLYNPENIYLFKSRRHPRTDDGLAPIKKDGIRKVYTRLTKEFGLMFTRNNLKISRMLNEMYKIDDTPEWTILRIKELKRELNLKLTETNIKIFYQQKYFPEYYIEKNKEDKEKDK